MNILSIIVNDYKKINIMRRVEKIVQSELSKSYDKNADCKREQGRYINLWI